jgi:3-oxoacyl-[acyl-carrier protein] reductase
MQISFNGRKALVAGGSRGIGRSIALALASTGASVAICARGEAALRETERELRSFGVNVHAGVCDLADGPAVERWVADAAGALGGIDVLVNNASGFGRSDDEPGWAASINVDLLATVRATRAALPWLEKSRGAIVHVSSISGLRPSVRTPPYGAVKAALIQMTMTQAAALAPKGVRVNCVAPGSIEFPGGVWDQAKRNAPARYEGILRTIPSGRMGRPEEVANVVLFLASELASWVTGTTVAIDGGQVLS